MATASVPSAYNISNKFINQRYMEIQEALQHKIDHKTKPVGALGRLESIALQVGQVQQTLEPVIRQPHIVVFAADHGIAAGGKVNPYPQSVTAQMVLNFVNGGAAINVFCRQHNIALVVVDAGVNYDFDPGLPIVHAKQGKGTADYSEGWAMHTEAAVKATAAGADMVKALAAKGCNCIGLGEMGIGNSSSAALIMHHYTDLPLAQCVGRGTGANDEQLRRKLQVLEEAAQLHELARYDITPHGLLGRVGGYEIAQMAGAYVEAYRQGMMIVVDGFIATAALLVAIKLLNEPAEKTVQIGHGSALLRHCIFAHTSGEAGHAAMLERLGAQPLLQLGMRLGEGTGAALAIPLVQAAVNFLNEMASFDSAGVDNQKDV
jgi:nicotinate-nucleotide--dimethylbenzimidazole phosphoribosyltransferase